MRSIDIWEWVIVEDHAKLSLYDRPNRVPIDYAIITCITVSEALLLWLCLMGFFYFILFFFFWMTKSKAQKQREYWERKKLNDKKYLENKRRRQKCTTYQYTNRLKLKTKNERKQHVLSWRSHVMKQKSFCNELKNCHIHYQCPVVIHLLSVTVRGLS